MKTICLISLGCPKNLVDSEKIIGILGNLGYAITTNIEESDYVIVNTCSFIKPAIAEAEEIISRLKKMKKRFHFRIIISGCLPARNPEVFSNDKQVDGVIGPYDIVKMPELIARIEQGEKVHLIKSDCIKHYCRMPRAVSTFPYAYLKIVEGCSNMCSYCTIPLIRGSAVSFPEKEILKEAGILFKAGIKELIIVGHDITSYGKDTQNGSLVHLLEEISRIGFPWIRLMYLHPSGITDDLLDLINDNSCFCKYLDIPIKKINPIILQKMNRPVIDYERFFEHIKKSVRGVCLRTTLMVGFPGETDRIFNHLISFIKEMRFHRLGAFMFSPEEETKACMMENQVASEIKQERLRRLMAVQKEISRQISSALVGHIVDVITEKRTDNYFEGRMPMDAPDIDCMVRFKGYARLGDIVKVKIYKSSPYVLYGRTIP
ncbi:MAG TPA: 30S ribosomal protein S12 methylthiotransferase RimO [bacterium]|nr:30S ribosomal protein S12 methylthiotransferase RimO [bacterium]